jgi:hypothetical protein
MDLPQDVIWRNASLHLQTQASSKALQDGGLTVSTVTLEWIEHGKCLKKTAHEYGIFCVSHVHFYLLQDDILHEWVLHLPRLWHPWLKMSQERH